MCISDWSSDVCSSDLVNRFKGLGEMNPQQLRETTMDPKTRSMIRITLPQEYEERAGVRDLVERLMGKNTEHRFAFIKENGANDDEEGMDRRSEERGRSETEGVGSGGGGRRKKKKKK